jgi:hypothetical protein
VKAHLLYPDQDFDLHCRPPWGAEALTQDLALNTLFEAMARGNKFVLEVANKVVLAGMSETLETIRYRQNVLQDCLSKPAVVRELYAVAVEAREAEKKHYLGVLARHPDWVLRRSIELMETFLGMMKKLRKIADSHGHAFASEGWTTFFAMLERELSDDYLARIQYDLQQLRFRNGVLLSAELGQGNKGDGYVLRHLPSREETWLTWLFARLPWLPWLFRRQPPVYSFSLDPRDEGGARALAALRDRGISLVANALGQATEHVSSFFGMLQTELAFYLGCANLHDELDRKRQLMCFPSPVSAGERRLSFRGLCDVCLALSMDQRVVGNDASADAQDLVIVTGANQGGKSTFLRSIGLAQLMMQCGMFVAAQSFCSSVRDRLFTHYKREEDPNMKSGKLDEELSRMSDIVDHTTSHSMILFNESFAATNEREGSEIARQIISALLDKQVKIVFVTHLYELAQRFYEKNDCDSLFLRAERRADGTRTFKVLEGEPLQTSFGEDLYDSIFAEGNPHVTL